MKGQSLSIDFILGFFVLLFVFALFFSFWHSYEFKRQSFMSSDEMYSFATNSLRFLLESPGYPGNWSTNVSTVQSLGLSDGSGGISQEKLRAFVDANGSMYANYVKVLGVSPYDFYFVLSTFNGSSYEVADAVGIAPPQAATVTVSRREVLVNDTWGRAEMFVWTTT